MDLEYFRQFYQYDAENKAKQSEDEFLANVEHLYSKYDFGVALAGWDELAKRAIEAERPAAKDKTPKALERLGRLIAGEFARHKDLRRVRDSELNTIAKILLRDPAMLPDAKPNQTAPADEEKILQELSEDLKNPVADNKTDFDKCRLYPDSYTSGAILQLRNELIRKRGLTEFRQYGVAPADPHKYFTRDYIGLAPQPSDYTITKPSCYFSLASPLG